jgi:Retrotransposon gag protein
MSIQPDSALLLLVQQLQQELQNQRTEIQSLRTDLNASRADVHQLQCQLQNQPRPSRSHLPDPPRFNGRPYTLRTWLPSIKAKLRSDQLTGADAFDYVWDRLEQPQQASCLHLRDTAEANQQWDPEEIFLFFQRICYNPREQQEAVQRFASVRQKDDESLLAYLARFERLSYEAGAQVWPSTSRISSLHRGLRASLRQLLEESNDSLFSQSYDDYVELVQRTDRRTRQPVSQKAARTAARQSPPPDRMDINHLSHARSRSHSRSRPCSRSSSSSSASSAQRQHRYSHDLCYYCGSDRHWIKDCAQAKPQLLLTAPRTRTKLTASYKGGPRPS